MLCYAGLKVRVCFQPPSVQMPEIQLLRVKLRRTPLGVAFHLRDLVGLGVVQRIAAPSGTMIRISVQKRPSK